MFINLWAPGVPKTWVAEAMKAVDMWSLIGGAVRLRGVPVELKRIRLSPLFNLGTGEETSRSRMPTGRRLNACGGSKAQPAGAADLAGPPCAVDAPETTPRVESCNVTAAPKRENPRGSVRLNNRKDPQVCSNMVGALFARPPASGPYPRWAIVQSPAQFRL